MTKIWNAFDDKWMVNEHDVSDEVLQYIDELYQTSLAQQEIIEKHEETIKELEKILQQISKKRGRKQMLTPAQIDSIRKMRKMGVPLQEIADYFNCSIALVHKTTKDIPVDTRRKGTHKAHIKKN